MTRCLCLLGLLTTTAAAQYNPFVVFPQDPERQNITCASFVTRPQMAAAGEAHQELRGSWFHGISDANGVCLAFGMYHWAADEDLGTSETYGLVLRTAAANGAPDTTPGSEFVRVSGLTTPPGTPLRRGTWRLTDGFATQVVVTNVHTWFMGIDLPANPAWPASDGHSLWAADRPEGSLASLGENPRPGAPDVTWAVPASGAPVTTQWTYILGVLSIAPNLHIGGLDPGSARLGTPNQASFGMNGLFPDISGTPRRDGIRVRLTDSFMPGSVGIVGISDGLDPVGLYTSPIGGSTVYGFVYVNTRAFVLVGFGPLVGGALDLNVAAPASLPTALVGFSFAMQGVVFTPQGVGAWSNAQTMGL